VRIRPLLVVPDDEQARGTGHMTEFVRSNQFRQKRAHTCSRKKWPADADFVLIGVAYQTFPQARAVCMPLARHLMNCIVYQLVANLGSKKISSPKLLLYCSMPTATRRVSLRSEPKATTARLLQSRGGMRKARGGSGRGLGVDPTTYGSPTRQLPPPPTYPPSQHAHTNAVVIVTMPQLHTAT